MLTASGISHSYGRKTVLDGVDLAVAPGEVIGLVGPSGAGKSTLGRIVAGHLRPTSGRVEIGGIPLQPGGGRPAPVQYAPQSSELSVDPRWRVNRILRNGGEPDRDVLRVLDIRADWYDRYAAELSGGELARVSLARLLLPTTRYIVCDEVTAPLDALAAEALWLALRDLARRGLGVVVISHATGMVRRHTDRTCALEPVEPVGRNGDRQLPARGLPGAGS